MMVLKSNNRARPGRGDMETIVHRCARCLPACIAGGTARTTDCDTASTAGSIPRQRGAGWPAAWPRITPRPPWQATSPQHGPGWQGRGGRQADLPRLLRWLADQDAVPPSDTPSSWLSLRIAGGHSDGSACGIPSSCSPNSGEPRRWLMPAFRRPKSGRADRGPNHPAIGGRENWV